MKSKQRVAYTIQHREPDYIPMGELEIDAPIIEKVLGRPTFYGSRLPLLKAYMEGRRDEVVESMKKDYVEFIRKVEYDIAEVRLVPDKDTEFLPLKEFGEFEFEDVNGNVLKWHPVTMETLVFKEGSGPVKLAESPHWKPGELYEPTESELEFAKYVIKELGDTHFIIGPVGGIGMPAAQMGWPAGLPYRATSHVDRMMDGILDRPEEYREEHIAHAKAEGRAARFWKLLGCDAIWTAFDYGYNKGPFMSPSHFDEIFFPGLETLAEEMHRLNLPHIFHSCGNNRLLWRRLADAGVDVYQSIQEIEPLADLKKEIGDQVTLWGGVFGRVLHSGSKEEIKEVVRRAIETARPGGGLILGSTHSLGPDVDYDIYMAMLEAWHRYR